MLVRPINVLLVEDNPADARLTLEAMRDSRLTVDVDDVRDGDQAMAFLRREGKYRDARYPDLILLDLNLPNKDGREVLSEIKADPVLMQIPVVILTSSKLEEDIARAYQLHANCFVSKPVDLDQFQKAVASIKDFWFTIVKLPQEDAA